MLCVLYWCGDYLRKVIFGMVEIKLVLEGQVFLSQNKYCLGNDKHGKGNREEGFFPSPSWSSFQESKTGPTILGARYLSQLLCVDRLALSPGWFKLWLVSLRESVVFNIFHSYSNSDYFAEMSPHLETWLSVRLSWNPLSAAAFPDRIRPNGRAGALQTVLMWGIHCPWEPYCPSSLGLCSRITQ